MVNILQEGSVSQSQKYWPDNKKLQLSSRGWTSFFLGGPLRRLICPWFLVQLKQSWAELSISKLRSLPLWCHQVPLAHVPPIKRTGWGCNTVNQVRALQYNTGNIWLKNHQDRNTLINDYAGLCLLNVWIRNCQNVPFYFMRFCREVSPRV